MKILTPTHVTEEDMRLFLANFNNSVLMKRAQAIVNLRRARQLVEKLPEPEPLKDGLKPVANIPFDYYITRKAQEQEANPERAATDENVWDDPEFLPWEMKKHEELRPRQAASKTVVQGHHILPPNG